MDHGLIIGLISEYYRWTWSLKQANTVNNVTIENVLGIAIFRPGFCTRLYFVHIFLFSPMKINFVVVLKRGFSFFVLPNSYTIIQPYIDHSSNMNSQPTAITLMGTDCKVFVI